MGYLIVTYSVSNSASEREKDIESFENKVRAKLDEGYTPIGNVTIGKNTRWEDQMLYAQAMIKN